MVLDALDGTNRMLGRATASQIAARADNELRLFAIGPFPAYRIRSILLLSAGTLANPGYDRLGKSALQRRGDYRKIAALTLEYRAPPCRAAYPVLTASRIRQSYDLPLIEEPEG
ncbi:hypothetical protein ABIB75_008099 [Bradyrhizobium sp. GM2.2]|uniref:hypothetical protein n=1 Tax=Bradyrhizobium sp. GM2.2 TaxID=3156358 RepID=UPI003393E5D0